MSFGGRPVYMTAAGKAQLEKELLELVTVRRPEITERIHEAKEAADAGDSSEFEDAKNEQAFLEGQIRTLELKLQNAVIIEHEVDHEVVRLGSHVTVADDAGEVEEFVIVGSAEANPRAGRISNESPVGRALLGRRPGERVQVTVPAGLLSFTIKSTE